MEIDTEKAEQAIKELSDVFTKAFMPVAEAIKNISTTLCHTFIDTWESIKEKMPDFEKMKISRDITSKSNILNCFSFFRWSGEQFSCGPFSIHLGQRHLPL